MRNTRLATTIFSHGAGEGRVKVDRYPYNTRGAGRRVGDIGDNMVLFGFDTVISGIRGGAEVSLQVRKGIHWISWAAFWVCSPVPLDERSQYGWGKGEGEMGKDGGRGHLRSGSCVQHGSGRAVVVRWKGGIGEREPPCLLFPPR